MPILSSGSSTLAQPTFTVGFSPFRDVNSSNSVRSPVFGFLPLFFGSGTAHCGLGPFLGLASGLIVHHDGKFDRGLNLRCSNYGVVGAIGINGAIGPARVVNRDTSVGLTQPVGGPGGNTGQENLTPRTIGQKRVLKALDTDAFTVEWFNLGPLT